METDKNQANTILEKGVKKIDSLYEKLPIDDLNKKLNEKNINIDLRCPAAKITVGIIIIAVIIIIAKLIFGGDSIPQQSTVDRMITEKREQLGIEKVVSISYENVDEISKNVYHTQAVIELHGEITKDWAHAASAMGAKVGDTYDKTVVQDLVISYAGNVVEIDFGQETEVK